MKISNASKKVLASALSAAMVVAFAPAVAFGAVVEDNGGNSAEQAPAVSADVVATVSWQAVKDGAKYTVTEEFKATDEASYDNAVQAAFAFAANPKATGYTNATSPKTTVQLQKDVAVDAPAGVVFAHDDNGEWVAEAADAKFATGSSYYQKLADGTYKAVDTSDTTKFVDGTTPVAGLYKVVRTSVIDPDVEVAGALLADGEFTVDLNGHKLTNTANVELDKNGALVAAEDGVVVVDKYAADGVAKTADKTVTENVYVAKTAATSVDAAETAIMTQLKVSKLDAFSQLEGEYKVTGKDSKGDTYTKVSSTATGTHYAYSVTYTKAGTYTDKAAAAAAKITLTDSQKSGLISSTNATPVVAEDNTELTLGDVSVSFNESEGLKFASNGEAIDAHDTIVTGAATVTSKALGTTAAIGGTNVTVKKGAALTATAESTAAPTNGYAAAIWASKYVADKAATVDASAKANGAAAANGETGSTIDPSTGLITGKNDAKGAAKNVHSYAVLAGEVAIDAGKYSAEYAVANGANVVYTENKAAAGAASNEKLEPIANDDNVTAGTIKYGEFTGHVYGATLAGENAKAASGKLAIQGGIYSESPANTMVEVNEIKAGVEQTKATKTYMGSYLGDDYAVATDGSKFYAYKTAAAASSWTDDTTAAWDATGSKALIKVEEVAKPAADKAIADWFKGAVESLATGKAPAGLALTAGTEAVAVQKALIDGNVAIKDGQVSLKVTPKRVDPKSSKLTDAEKQLLSDIDKVADEQSQSVQSVFSISAQLNQGYNAKTAEAVKIADVNDMGDTKVKVTVRPVTTNTEAQGVYADGKTFDLTMQQAVTNNQNVPASFETSSLASFGILYSSPADAIKKADKAAAKVVTDEIANISAKFATVDSSNYEAALAAVAEAEKDYSKLTDAQRKYVSEEQLAAIAKVKAEAEAVKATQPAAKKANTAKASKSKVSVKKGKKATVKVTKAKGKVTVKSSSKNAKVSYKSGKITIKGAKKGKATVTVKAAGNASYKAKTLKIKVTVK